MPQRFDNFFHTVEGNEGERCHYPTRLDTYGCGCQHNCGYCYARSLLAFRGMWNAQMPAAVAIKDVLNVVNNRLRPGDIVRLGGMTDRFQPIEAARRNTWRTIRMLNARGVHYLIVTKNDLVAEDRYIEVLDRRLAHIQVSITSTDEEVSRKMEPGAPGPERRIAAVERLAAEGFDVSVRLSPYIPQLVDVERINAIECDKILVEFLRVNSWIEKWMAALDLGVDLGEYDRNVGGYKHLPLAKKIELLSRVTGFPQLSVCEDVPEDWEYWRSHVNSNPDDCCNLKMK